jgi:hypothetical protein
VKLLAALVLSSTLAACVSGAASAREIGASGRVASLSATAVEVAYAAEVRPRCFEIRVWNTADRGVRRYASHCFPATSTGSGVAGVTVVGGRALWLTFAGGNFREWSLWTKSQTSRARRIRFVSREVDGPPPIVLGSAWEGSLPYSVDRTIVVLGSNGARRFALTAPERVVSVSAHSRGYAAVLADGRVLTISSTGTVLRERAFEPGFVEAAVLAGPGLILKTRNGLQIRKDESVREISLPAGSRFQGYSEGLLAYSSGRQLRLLRLSDTRNVVFRTLERGFHAQLGRQGIAYASGSRVSFNAWVVVASAVAP